MGEEISVKEFAERQGIGEIQVRRILEHPDRYPWGGYGITNAHKVGYRWKIRLTESPVSVTAPGADRLVDRVALVASSLENKYPMRQVLTDLQTQPLDQVFSKVIQRLPPPSEVTKRIAEAAKEGPPPDQVLFKIKQIFH